MSKLFLILALYSMYCRSYVPIHKNLRINFWYFGTPRPVYTHIVLLTSLLTTRSKLHLIYFTFSFKEKIIVVIFVNICFWHNVCSRNFLGMEWKFGNIRNFFFHQTKSIKHNHTMRKNQFTCIKWLDLIKQDIRVLMNTNINALNFYFSKSDILTLLVHVFQATEFQCFSLFSCWKSWFE